ncbi:MAG: DUF362 domain-containing protein [Spirochaetales bacterium]|nr:DUF362 domain-containing protein [Spirochaetales bacterium]
MSVPVALLKCESYEQGEIDRQLSRLTELTDFPDVKGKRVLLKPNLLSGSTPDRAVTTHPEVLRGAIKLMQNQGAASVVVGDSPGVGSPLAAARKAGLYQVCEECGAEWVVFDETEPYNCEEALLHNQFMLTKEVSRAEIIVSLPKMKTHGLLYFTGAMKNLFGLIPGLNKSGFHMRYPDKKDFAQLVADLNLTVRADYAIMDGIVAMEGRGPGNGTPRPMNLLLGSADLLALDIAASGLIGYDGPRLPLHEALLKSSLWINNPEQIEYRGEPWEEFRCEDFQRIPTIPDYVGMVPPLLRPLLKNLIVPRPFFRHKSCVLCGKCLEICSPKALSFKGEGKARKVAIDYDKCIRCYCCDEVCPVGAIHLKRRF